jgi:hypothetical protein
LQGGKDDISGGTKVKRDYYQVAVDEPAGDQGASDSVGKLCKHEYARGDGDVNRVELEDYIGSIGEPLYHVVVLGMPLTELFTNE